MADALTSTPLFVVLVLVAIGLFWLAYQEYRKIGQARTHSFSRNRAEPARYAEANTPKYDDRKIEVKIENSPTFNNSPTINQHAELNQRVQPPEAETKLEFTRFRKLTLPMNVGTGIYLGDNTIGFEPVPNATLDGRYQNVDVGLMRFEYDATSLGVVPKVGVRAQITIYDAASLRKDKFDAVWHKAGHHSKTFADGDSDNLILGVLYPEGMVAYEFHQESYQDYNGEYLSPKLEPLEGKLFYLRVVLSGFRHQEKVLTKKVWVLMDVEKGTIVAVQKPDHLW